MVLNNMINDRSVIYPRPFNLDSCCMIPHPLWKRTTFKLWNFSCLASHGLLKLAIKIRKYCEIGYQRPCPKTSFRFLSVKIKEKKTKWCRSGFWSYVSSSASVHAVNGYISPPDDLLSGRDRFRFARIIFRPALDRYNRDEFAFKILFFPRDASALPFFVDVFYFFFGTIVFSKPWIQPSMGVLANRSITKVIERTDVELVEVG